MFPFFNDPFVDLSLVGEGLPVSVFMTELFIYTAGNSVDKFLDGFGVGDSTFVLDGGDLIQGSMFSDVQGDKFSAPFVVRVSQTNPVVVLLEPGVSIEEVVVHVLEQGRPGFFPGGVVNFREVERHGGLAAFSGEASDDSGHSSRELDRADGGGFAEDGH